jgi:putative tryptophan/tyrosine transport system substrate-binding protein
MFYGVDFADMFHQAASYVDRVLRGDKPADLPVQAATKFETVVNLKMAKALGLTVPRGRRRGNRIATLFSAMR